MLINDFSAALHRDLLQHGRLYVTHNYVCFYSAIFNKKEIIPTRSITSIKKEKTAYVVCCGRVPFFFPPDFFPFSSSSTTYRHRPQIPNAVRLTLESGDKVTFASLLSRETTFRCLFEVWQAVMHKGHTLPDDIFRDGYDHKEGTSEDLAAIAETNAAYLAAVGFVPALHRSVSTTSISSTADSASAANAGPKTKKTRGTKSSTSSGDSLQAGRPSVSVQGLSDDAEPEDTFVHVVQSGGSGSGGSGSVLSSSTAPPQQQSQRQPTLLVEPVECACTDHFGRLYIDADVSCPVDFCHGLFVGFSWS